MRFGWAMGVTCAVGAHLGFLLFGGLLFLHDEEEHSSVEVELVSEAAAEEEQEEEAEPEPSVATEELQVEEEPPPDADEIVRSLELAAAANKEKLEAASLSAIEAALSGRGGGGDFAEAVSFNSGGSLLGTLAPGALGKQVEESFSMDEIDQKPRVLFQAAPLYPSQMRGRKVEGLVTVKFIVDATGKVLTPRIESSTDKAFEKPALDAVKQWTFEPAVKGGQRVACKMRAPIRFQPS